MAVRERINQYIGWSVPSAGGAEVRKWPQCAEGIPNREISAWILTSKVNIDKFEGPAIETARGVDWGGRQASNSLYN